MKKILLILLAAIWFLGIQAQEMSSPMANYLKGCELMTEAIQKKSFEILTDSKLAMAKVKLTDYSTEDFAPVDSLSASCIEAPAILFTPEYANLLIQNGTFSTDNSKYTHIMRANDDYDLQIWNASIKAHSRAEFEGVAMGHCEMLLYTPDEKSLRFEVRDNQGKEIKCSVSKSKTSWVAVWEMPAYPSDFTFSITNDSAKNCTFVVALN